MVFQTEEKCVQRFLDLRSLHWCSSQEFGAGGRWWGARSTTYHLRILLCGTHCLQILGSLMIMSSPAPLEINSSYTHSHPHPYPGLVPPEANPHPQLAANTVLFLCGNVAGVYHKALMERALRATFREALSSLHSRRRLDTEKKHQVCLYWGPGGTQRRRKGVLNSHNWDPSQAR